MKQLTHTMYLCVFLYGSRNEKRLFARTESTDWFLGAFEKFACETRLLGSSWWNNSALAGRMMVNFFFVFWFGERGGVLKSIL